MKRISRICAIFLFAVLLVLPIKAQDFTIERANESPKHGSIDCEYKTVFDFIITPWVHDSSNNNLFFKEVTFINDTDLDGITDHLELCDMMEFRLYRNDSLLQTKSIVDGALTFVFSNPDSPLLTEGDGTCFKIKVLLRNSPDTESSILRLRVAEVKVFLQETGELFTVNQLNSSVYSGVFTILEPMSRVDVLIGPFGADMRDVCTFIVKTPFPFAGMQFRFMDTTQSVFLMPTEGILSLDELFEYSVQDLNDGWYGVLIALKDPENIQESMEYTFVLPFKASSSVQPYETKHLFINDMILSSNTEEIPNVSWEQNFPLEIGKKGNLTFPKDQNINITDYIRAKRVLLDYAYTQYEWWASDMNDDQVISINDIILLRNAIFDYEIPQQEMIKPVVKTGSILYTPAGLGGIQIEGMVEIPSLPAGWTLEKNGNTTILYTQTPHMEYTETIYYTGTIQKIIACDQLGRTVEVQEQMTSVEDYSATNSVIAFPNPVMDMGTIQYTVPEAGPSHIEIVNVSGHKVFEIFESNPNGTLLVNTMSWPKGIYMIRITNNNTASFQQWIKSE